LFIHYWNYAPLFFIHYYFKNPKILKFFLPLPWPHYNLKKSSWSLNECFLKVCEHHSLVKYYECLLVRVFWVKTQAKTLEIILVRKYTFNLSAFFHNWLSCEFKRLTHVWFLSVCLCMVTWFLEYWFVSSKVHSFNPLLMWNKIPQNKFWNRSIFPKSAKRISVWLWWVRIFSLI